MRAAVVAEYRKLVTTRLWWILLLTMVVYMAFIAGAMGWVLSQGQATSGPGDEVTLSPQEVVRTVYTIAVSLGYVFPLVVGGLSYPSEVRHSTLTPTYLSEPRRGVVLGAKLLSGGALGLVYGLAGTLACVAAGGGVLALLGEPTFLGEASTWRTLGLSTLALALWALLGVAVGTVVTSQVAVVVGALAFTQFVEPIARVALGQTAWGGDVAAYLPGAAGEAISGGSFYASSGMTGGLLTAWQGLLVMLAYVAVLSLVGRATTLRRDIT